MNEKNLPATGPAPTTEQLAEAQRLRQSALQNEREAEASFERCDTDGFLSQWASRISAEVDEKNAMILQNGGMMEFPAVFTLDGKFQPAVRCVTRYGTAWSLTDASGTFLQPPVFLPFSPQRESTIKNKGYTIGAVMRPAVAKIVTEGKRAVVAIRPLGRYSDAPASVISTDIFNQETKNQKGGQT